MADLRQKDERLAYTKRQRDVARDQRDRLEAAWNAERDRRLTAEQANEELRAAAWRLVRDQSRMLDRWAEADEHVRLDLWRNLHRSGDRLRDALEATGESAA